ncbi:hypothetical protein Gotur_002997 [Gossypium turneri]
MVFHKQLNCLIACRRKFRELVCMENENVDRAYENIIDPEDVHDGEIDDDGESNNSSGYEMELTRDAINYSLMNSL